LTGVALCHDILIARAFAWARRQLGLAGLTAMLAAHVGLAFEIVFAGHAGSMPARGIGSLALFSPVNEFIGVSSAAVHDGLKCDEIGMNRHRALGCCLRMIFSEDRFSLFRIML
jgi:hypothetical protein